MELVLSLLQVNSVHQLKIGAIGLWNLRSAILRCLLLSTVGLLLRHGVPVYPYETVSYCLHTNWNFKV